MVLERTARIQTCRSAGLAAPRPARCPVRPDGTEIWFGNGRTAEAGGRADGRPGQPWQGTFKLASEMLIARRADPDPAALAIPAWRR